jgi:hypothetical protein
MAMLWLEWLVGSPAEEILVPGENLHQQLANALPRLARFRLPDGFFHPDRLCFDWSFDFRLNADWRHGGLSFLGAEPELPLVPVGWGIHLQTIQL